MKLIFAISFSLLIISCRTTISGQLLNPLGQPIQSVEGKVNISSLTQSELSEVVSIDKSGQFSSNFDVEPGDYFIEPLIPGYESSAVKIKVKGDRKVTLTAKPLPSKKSKALGTHQEAQQFLGSGGALIAPPKF